MLKPFNEAFLWKGKIQRANYPNPTPKPPMDLPRINTVTGKPYPTKNSLHDEQCLSAYAISQNYWAGERQRRQAYREKYAGPPSREPEERGSRCVGLQMILNHLTK